MVMQSKESKELYNYLLQNVKGQNPPLTVEQSRANVETFGESFNVPEEISIEEFTIDHIPAEWIETPKSDPKKVALFLHLGGFISGSKKASRSLNAEIIRRSGLKGLAIDYKLAPEFPYPSALKDVEKTYDWLLKQGYKSENIVFVGESAGGALAVSTLIKLKSEKAKLPGACVLITPITDLIFSGESIKNCAESDVFYSPDSIDYKVADMYANRENIKSPLISPLFGNLTGLPAILIQAAENDIFLDDAIRIAKKAADQEVYVKLEKWPGMWHLWHYFHETIPESGKAIDHICEFINQL